MKMILGFFVSRWVVSCIAAAVLVALVWDFAPFIGLGGLIVRLVVILVTLLVLLVLLAAWSGANFLLDRRQQQRDAALAAGVAGGGGAMQARAVAQERAALSAKLRTSLSLLRKASGSRGYLHEQPWYVIIGPPGAGKTTALLNAGLTFPLAAELGQGAVAGVGGTRLCDWWFIEQAVLIDTAGRYTTQDSDAATDKAGWEGFLDLLKRTRRPQALNGVIVAISLADIAAAPREERLAHARAIRKRVRELTTRLGLKLPVYALLTKADLLAGFTEFFDDLDQEQRGQVWGATFPAEDANPVATFEAEFKLLVQRLDERLIDAMQRERSPERRSLIVGFPAQVASLEAPLNEFVAEAFGGSPLDPAPYLRGVYMTSGTQEGTPVDRLTGALSRTFGIDQRRFPAPRPATGRSYFLTRLLKDVIFGEAMLAGQTAAQRRRFMVRQFAGYAAVALVFLLSAGGLLLSRAQDAAAIAASNAAVANYAASAKGLALDPVQEANLLAVLPMLDAARAMPFGPDDNAGYSHLGLGLDQGQKLAAGARMLYTHALDNVFLPRLILQLEAEMRGGFDRPDDLYQATRVYLMLGGQGPMDKALVEAWMDRDWQRLYPGLAAQPVRDDLMQHLVAMLNAKLPPVPLDFALVEAARASFSHVPVAERVYSRIRDSAAAAAIPAWVPAEAMGAAGVPLFTRASGKPLTEGIPGFYTVKGFQLVLLPALSHAAKDAAAERWVLGPGQRVDPSSPDMQNLEQNLLKLYEADYEAQWNAMLGDLNLKPVTDAGQAAQTLGILGAPQSPMQRLLASITAQLQLSQGVTAFAGATSVSAEATALQGLMGTATAPNGGAPLGAEVDAYYAPLIDYVGNGPGAPMSLTLNLMHGLQQQLATLAPGAPGSVAPAAGAGPAALLQAEAVTQPQPVSRWLQALVVNANGLRGGNAARAAAAFNGAAGPAKFCQQAVAGRYPFVPTSGTDISLEDFAQLFAPNGRLDSFFTQQVQPFVDKSGSIWQVQAVNGAPPPISQEALAQFQRAETIKQLFFADGTSPSVQFSLTPVALDEGAAQAVLELGALNVTYAHGLQLPTIIAWPSADGIQTARLTITPAGGGNPAEIDASGPWALFHLLSQGMLARTGSSDTYTLTFTVGGHSVSYSIGANAALNPFAPGLLADFRCPSLRG